MNTDHTQSEAAADTRDTAGQCVDFLQSIVYLLDNELTEVDMAAVRGHLDHCNPCFQDYDLQRRVKELVARSCAETAPEELRAKIVRLCREVSAQ